MPPAPPLDTGNLWRYAALGLPLALPTVAVYVLLPTWYFETFGLPLTLIGAILLLTRLLDVLTDPLIGIFIDRFPGIKPARLIFGAGLICAPSLLLLVNPWQQNASLSLLLGLLFLYLGWTLIQIPYLAWLPRLHGDSHQRNRAASARETMTIAGLVISAALPLGATLAGLNLQQGLNLLVGITVLAGLVAIRALWGLPYAAATGQKATPYASSWRLFQHNRLALRLLSAWFLNGLANGFPAVLFPLFVSAWLGGSEQTRALYILLYFGAAILSLPLWLFMSRYITRARLWCLAMIAAISAFALAPLLSPATALGFVPICLVTGAALGADLTLPHVLQAEVSDWDRYRFGQERNGILFACWNMATKLALALSAGFAFVLLGASGFESDNAEPLWLLGLIYAGLPCVFKGVAVLLLWNFPLQSGHHRAIRHRLARRLRSLHAHEPDSAVTADQPLPCRMHRHEN
ncbi:MFS transporter [Marinobacterium rhizophilum]|uniref:MFS transporter n=1 Tax=Marinobacterium rhizophilum TaxID=420402 RepID=UPI00035D066D|nr:MFS transporter [Marinobacterium rhizophilum]